MRAGTIVASNYLEMARLLAESFLAHHPDDTFSILLVDDLPVDVPSSAGCDVVRLADLDFDAVDLDTMKTIYDVMELSTAVKPAFLEVLLRHDEIAVYLDPDIFVYAPFGDLVAPAAESGIVLTPHVLEPIPRDGAAPNERMIMGSGIFNLGFVAVGRSAVEFLAWWQERLLVDSISDPEANLFTDQRWVDWVPALFGCHVCRDPGMNIAWWNVHERDLACHDGDVTVDGSPVRFVHFSGYDPSRPERLSKHQEGPRTPHVEGSVIRALAEAYGRALQDNGHDERRSTPYQWDTTATGRSLSTAVRREARRALLGGARTGTEAGSLDRSVPMAFGPTADGFEAWLGEPVAGSGAFTFDRVETALWSSRGDLQTVFRDLDIDRDAAAYRNWLNTDPTAREALGDRWAAKPVDLTPAPATGVATAQRGFAQRAVGRARREVAPYVERVRARVGRP